MLSMLVTPETASALAESEGDTNTLIFNEQGLAALDKSVYVDLTTNSAHVDKEKALYHYNFTDHQLNAVQSKLDNLTDEEIESMVNYSLSNSGDDLQTRVAPLIVWGGIAALGIFSGAALYFSSKYMNHLEKQNLINRCYDVGGTPSLDSGDTGGMGGAPKKAWWKISNSYSFECVK